jgi:hypothetical protein
MNRQLLGRMIAVLVGGAVMFGLELWLGLQFYIAIPIGVVTYLAVRLGFGLVWGTDGAAQR